jgi:hypothetical protein
MGLSTTRPKMRDHCVRLIYRRGAGVRVSLKLARQGNWQEGAGEGRVRLRDPDDPKSGRAEISKTETTLSF